MTDKKVVMFNEFLGWKDHPAGAVQATLGGIEGHYRLGNMPLVLTSAVVRIQYAEPSDGRRDPMEIETLNTIYRRAE
jgi:hypothetical protein